MQYFNSKAVITSDLSAVAVKNTTARRKAVF